MLINFPLLLFQLIYEVSFQEHLLARLTRVFTYRSHKCAFVLIYSKEFTPRVTLVSHILKHENCTSCSFNKHTNKLIDIIFLPLFSSLSIKKLLQKLCLVLCFNPQFILFIFAAVLFLQKHNLELHISNFTFVIKIPEVDVFHQIIDRIAFTDLQLSYRFSVILVPPQ